VARAKLRAAAAAGEIIWREGRLPVTEKERRAACGE
jgi:hypothetical protein